MTKQSQLFEVIKSNPNTTSKQLGQLVRKARSDADVGVKRLDQQSGPNAKHGIFNTTSFNNKLYLI